MAKVTITIDDIEGKEGAINMNYSFDPDLPQESSEEATSIPLTPAQTLAMHIHNFMQRLNEVNNEEETSSEAEGSAEEGCAQTGEDTCCGGNCHADSTEA